MSDVARLAGVKGADPPPPPEAMLPVPGAPRESEQLGRLMRNPPRPVTLPANQPSQFYRGGTQIAALRGAPNETAGCGPEDWVASTTTRFGEPEIGLSLLPGGRTLRAEIEADPTGWLGQAHVERFGTSTALLVKLLDAGQRLPVHYHPSDGFARAHLHSPFGKTEAWIVVGTSEPDPTVYAGFRDGVSAQTADQWVFTQDSEAMLGALNPLSVTVGDTVVIPAGLPHAIGPGVFVVELQQPTDLSITMEWKEFLASPEDAHLGIGFATALQCLDRSPWSPERLRPLLRVTAGIDSPRVDLLGADATGFFRAERLSPRPTMTLDPGFSVLVVLAGNGSLRSAGDSELALHKGSTVVVPHCAGTTTLAGELTAIRARPPDPAVADPSLLGEVR